MNKKILIATGAFFPENTPRSYRATELAIEFIRRGYDVSVCVDDIPGRSEFFNQYNCEWINLGARKWKHFVFPGENKFTNLINRISRRFFQLFFEFPEIEFLFLIKNKLKQIKDFDLLISIAVPYPVHWGVAFAWNKKRPIAKKWIADCGDPYMGDVMDTFRKPFYFKYLEKYFCKKCTNISIPFEGAKSGYYSELDNKIKVIPQGFNFTNIKSKCFNYKSHSVPTFCYAGTLIPGGRDPIKFIDFLNKLEIDFKFYIFTNNFNFVKNIVDQSSGRIILSQSIDHDSLIGIQSKMDFNVNFENSSNIQIPSKLIELCVIGRPILSINPIDFNSEIIMDFLNYNFVHSFKMENLDKYKIEHVTDEFINA